MDRVNSIIVAYRINVYEYYQKSKMNNLDFSNLEVRTLKSMKLEWTSTVLNGLFLLCSKRILLLPIVSFLTIPFYAAAQSSMSTHTLAMFRDLHCLPITCWVKALFLCCVFRAFHSLATSPLRSHQPQPTSSTHCSPSLVYIQATSASAGLRPHLLPSSHCTCPLQGPAQVTHPLMHSFSWQ